MENKSNTLLYSAEKKDKGMFLLQPLYDKNGKELVVDAKEYNVRISDSDIVKVEFGENGEIISVFVDKEETKKRKSEMKKRLSSLFDN